MTRTSQSQLDRRQFIGSALASGGVLAAASACPKPVLAAERAPKLPEGAVILLQGDSITDAGRNRKSTRANDAAALGRGYPCLLGGALLADYPKLQLKIYNRGISGNKVPDLAGRWQQDAVDLKPAILSILIGVNDIWHKLNGRYDGTIATYETGYRELLQRTLAEIPGVKIVVCEPFVLRCGAVNDTWFPEFDQRRAVAKKLADELKLTFVPFQTMFNKAVEAAPPTYWTGDGVHPTLAGHALMAKTWREVVGI